MCVTQVTLRRDLYRSSTAKSLRQLGPPLHNREVDPAAHTCADERTERLAFGPDGCSPLVSASAPPARDSAMRDIQPRAPEARTYMRLGGYARNSGFPGSGRCRSTCSSTRRFPTGIALAPEARLRIRLLGRLTERRHSTPAPPGAARETKTLTERARALGQARKRSRRQTARRRPSPGSHGIAPEIAARSDRRSFPPPSRLSIGSRKVS